MAGAGGIELAYNSGKGPIDMRGKAFIEDEESADAKKGSKRGQKPAALGKAIIVITELPYQAVKARLVEHVADLVNQGTLQGWALCSRLPSFALSSRAAQIIHILLSQMQEDMPVPSQEADKSQFFRDAVLD